MDARIRRQRGFTLLEVLVAIVILSVGLLGLAGLQTASLRNNHSAFLRSQATLLLNDMTDRMRANRGQALAGAYDTVWTDTSGGTDCFTTGTPPALGVCTAAAMASADVDAWLTTLAQKLPNGDGQVNVNGVSGIAAVDVRWADVRDGSLLQVSTATQL